MVDRMRHVTANRPRNGHSYDAGWVLLAFNIIALLISVTMLHWGLIELCSEGEPRRLRSVFLIGRVLIMVQLILLLPLAIIGLIRRRTGSILARINLLVLLFGIAGSAGALGCVWYAGGSMKDVSNAKVNFIRQDCTKQLVQVTKQE